jgi:aspartyl-tRNA(Asn)/glutamyl-tRNA(Gln) amidotransferase subunit B
VNVDMLANTYGLTTKDAITLLSLDDGERLEYFLEVVRCLVCETEQHEKDALLGSLGRITGNW